MVITVLGIGIVSLIVDGFATSPLLRLLQGVCLFGLGTALVIAVVSLVVVRLGGWRDPDAEFDKLVERSEWLSRGPMMDAGSTESGHGAAMQLGLKGLEVPEGLELPDGLEVADEDTEFDVLVRSAINELPIEFHRALEHVAIIVSDSGAVAIRGRDGRRRGAYGMYQGDTFAHDFFTERILIFRDTLLRDFGHDPELLRNQVRRVLRHELAHHLGWGERGVRNLGL
jgi:predicted Zn-dependent protease with MMP-like domain